MIVNVSQWSHQTNTLNLKVLKTLEHMNYSNPSFELVTKVRVYKGVGQV
jgi:hypothetical protein